MANTNIKPNTLFILKINNQRFSLLALFTGVLLYSPHSGIGAISDAEALNNHIFQTAYSAGVFFENVPLSLIYSPALSVPQAPVFHYYNPSLEMPVVYAARLATLPQELTGLPKDISPANTDLFFIVQAYFMEPGSLDPESGSGNFCFRPQHWLAPEGTSSLQGKWSIEWDLTYKVFPANKKAEGLKLSHNSLSVSFHDAVLSGNAPYLTSFNFSEKKTLLFWTLTTDNEKTANNTQLPNRKPDGKKHALTLHAFVTPKVFYKVSNLQEREKGNYFNEFQKVLSNEYAQITHLEKFAPTKHQAPKSIPQPSKPAKKVMALEFSKPDTTAKNVIDTLERIVQHLSVYARGH